jgi:hypothetical protein
MDTSRPVEPVSPGCGRYETPERILQAGAQMVMSRPGVKRSGHVRATCQGDRAACTALTVSRAHEGAGGVLPARPASDPTDLPSW